MVHLSVEGRENAVETLTGDQLIDILIEDEVDDDIADFEDRRVCLVILSDILLFCSKIKCLVMKTELAVQP